MKLCKSIAMKKCLHKDKVILFINYALDREDVRGSGGVDPWILNIGTEIRSLFLSLFNDAFWVTKIL
jgi:exoribonuclease II